MTEIQQTKVVLLDKTLADEVKETHTRKASLMMLNNSFIMLLKLTIIFFLSLVPMLLADFFALASFDEVSQYALRIDVLLITTILVTLSVYLFKKL